MSRLFLISKEGALLFDVARKLVLWTISSAALVEAALSSDLTMLALATQETVGA